ncbi:hypothetical protein cypCar_00049982, partial [Cyprinus carpio]
SSAPVAFRRDGAARIPPLTGQQGFRVSGRHGNSIPAVMDVSDEFDSGMEPTDDLASFEIVNLLDPSADIDGHVQESRDKAKLKTQLISAWNNSVTLTHLCSSSGWSLKGKPRLSKSSPVCLLGQSYQLSYSGERESFRRAFSSLLWMTYRRGFPPLDGSALTSDAGWGCMLRSAQMLLAQGLMLHMMPAGTNPLHDQNP